MKSLICFFITAFISLQAAQAGHLQQIDVRALPQDANMINNVSKMKILEPYVEIWVPNWNFKIRKEEVISEINMLYSEIDGYLKGDSLNGELFLYSGLVAHYAYNLDLQQYWESAKVNLVKARELMKDDFRPDWFLGLHYIKSLHTKEGMSVFLNIAKEKDVEDGLFWEDYALAAYFSQMLQNALWGLDKAKTTLGEDSDYEKLFGQKIRKKFSTPDKNSKIDSKQLWELSKSDSLIDFASYPLGYRVSIPSNWKVYPTPFQKKVGALSIEMEPVKGIKGDVVPSMSIFTYVAEKKENIEDFIKKFMKPNVDFEKCELGLGLNESSYVGSDSKVYSKEGGAKIILVYFERNEPEYKGIKLEKPHESSSPSGEVEYYSLTKDRIFSRFNGRLFYLILLDCSESVFDRTLPKFNHTLKSLIVE